jgi:hypothetical protein
MQTAHLHPELTIDELSMEERVDNRQWYIYESDETFGPFAYMQMLRLELEGRVTAMSLTALVGTADWVPWTEFRPVAGTPSLAQVSTAVGFSIEHSSATPSETSHEAPTPTFAAGSISAVSFPSPPDASAIVSKRNGNKVQTRSGAELGDVCAKCGGEGDVGRTAKNKKASVNYALCQRCAAPNGARKKIALGMGVAGAATLAVWGVLFPTLFLAGLAGVLLLIGGGAQWLLSTRPPVGIEKVSKDGTVTVRGVCEKLLATLPTA